MNPHKPIGSGALVQRLAKRIQKEFGVTILPETFSRVYAGHWQRSAGAASWSVKQEGTPFDILGSVSVTMLLKSKTLTLTIDRFGSTWLDSGDKPAKSNS